jgi:hypothetical protein
LLLVVEVAQEALQLATALAVERVSVGHRDFRPKVAFVASKGGVR